MTGQTLPVDPTALRTPSLSLLLGLALLLSAGCGGSGSSGPDLRGLPGGALTFLRPAADAPAFLTRDTTVLATRGEALRVDLFYQDPSDPTQPGDRFLRFDLDPESLARYPEDHPMQGAEFEAGDTVSIHISLSRDTLLVDMEPAGLRFASDARADLELSFGQADEDFDGDGEPDPGAVSSLRIWRQDSPGGNWFRQSDFRQVDEESEEVRADLAKFSVFALAL